MGRKWPYTCFLWCVDYRICSKQHVAFLCRSSLDFCQCVLLVSIWCTHTVAFILSKLEINLFILLDWSDFHIIDNLSMTIHGFTRRMLTSLSIDKMWLPRHVNLSINFRRLITEKGDGSLSFKTNELCFISFHMESNAPCYLLQVT